MKTKTQTAYRSQLPMVNWILAAVGIAMTAGFIGVELFATKPMFSLRLLLWGAGPYIILGLGCHDNRRNAEGRVTGFLLSAILLIVPAFFYFYALSSGDAQSGLIFLSMPFFMWIYAVIGFGIIRSRRPKRTESKNAL